MKPNTPVVVQRSINQIEGMSNDIGSAAGAVGELAAEVASIDEVLAGDPQYFPNKTKRLLALNAAIEAKENGAYITKESFNNRYNVIQWVCLTLRSAW